jgi:chromate reductase, NAD(P)H dehydrogenase (quinone)
MNKVKILIFAGSARKDSLNKKLAKLAADEVSVVGAEASLVDLKDFPMPLYDGDLEAESGLPPEAKKFKELLKSSHAFIIASPEYNSSISPLLKNVLDWASRKENGEAPLEAFSGKVAAIMSASPGGLGGIRGLVQLRAMLENIQVMVIPDQVTISMAHDLFLEDGKIKDSKKHDQIKQVASKLVSITSKLIS